MNKSDTQTIRRRLSELQSPTLSAHAEAVHEADYKAEKQTERLMTMRPNVHVVRPSYEVWAKAKGFMR